MKTIYNDIIPFKGYKCVNVCGVLFVRKGAVMRFKDFNHERIHTKQMQETLFLFFYLWYLVEWLIKLCACRDSHKAYRNISFEREAYKYERFSFYPKHRKHFAWIREL